MAQGQVSPHSLRLGELFALALGFVLSTLAVFARVYTKMRLLRPMLMEDYVSVLAWLFFLAYIALAVLVGKHDGSPEHIAHLSSIESAIYSPIIIAVKVSILLQYITLFVVNRGNTFHRAVQTLIVVNVLYYTINVILFVTECSPIQKLWKPDIPGHCTSRHTLGVVSAVMAVILDFSILLLPLPLIWRLQMAWKKKSRVIAVFGVGLLACIASVMRLVYQIELTHVPPNTPVYQLNIDRIGLWAFAEIAIGIIIGCLPVLPRFFKHFASTQPGSSSRFDILSSASRTFWRRLFRKSTASQSSGKDTSSFYRGRFFSRNRSSRASRAPYIQTLNLTRSSLHLVEKGLPEAPPPARKKVASVATPRVMTLHSEGVIGREYGRVGDVESGNLVVLNKDQDRIW
ncbi:hypothetical protein BDR22DRAFT_968475 [Usnea florida]